MAFVSEQRDQVRELARRVAAVATEPRMADIIRRWSDVNALRKPDRAPVWCRPVGCWKEILPPESLFCTDPLLRNMEYGFRQILFKRDVEDDTPVESWFAVPAVWRVDPPNTWGVDIQHRAPGVAGGAWAYEPPLRDEADFARLRLPAFEYDEAASREHLERAAAVLDGILPVRLTAHVPLSTTLGTAAADLRGLEQMMVDMIEAPDRMHRLMACLRDATLAAIDRLEAEGILTPNNRDPMTCGELPGPHRDGAPLTCRNLWAMPNSQEFDQVSPAMWEEFCLAYQKPLLARFGLVAYGCCENLTHKLDGVLSIPNLRIVTCSAWTNLDTVIERVQRRHCIMWRQKASDVVFPDDTETIRRDLDSGARRLKGCCYQVVLRELETLAGHADRLHVWTRLAKEAAARHA